MEENLKRTSALLQELVSARQSKNGSVSGRLLQKSAFLIRFL